MIDPRTKESTFMCRAYYLGEGVQMLLQKILSGEICADIFIEPISNVDRFCAVISLKMDDEEIFRKGYDEPKNHRLAKDVKELFCDKILEDIMFFCQKEVQRIKEMRNKIERVINEHVYLERKAEHLLGDEGLKETNVANYFSIPQ